MNRLLAGLSGLALAHCAPFTSVQWTEQYRREVRQWADVAEASGARAD